MRILVTGAAGFIFSNFIKLAKQKGYEICAVIDNLTYAADRSRIPPDIPFYKQDIAKCNWPYLLEKTQADVIVNGAAHTHVDNSIIDASEFIESNFLGVVNMVNGIRQRKKTTGKDTYLIQVSTDEVLGQLPLDSMEKWNEDAKLAPRNPYSASKASAELWLSSTYQTYGETPYTIVRAANNYGPNQHLEKFLPVIISKALKNEKIPVYGDGKNIREWLFVDDFCRGILNVIDLYQLDSKYVIGEIFHFGSNLSSRNIDTVQAVLYLMRKPESLIEFVLDRPGHDLKYALDYTKAAAILDWKPEMHFARGLQIVIDDIKKRMGL
jgi:dTDP-glucose 4,6-dehydratase